MKRIIVIGPSGSGKTTLAKMLSRKLGIRHIELDSLYHQANWQPVTDEEFIRQVKQATNESAWILCGNYYSKIGQEIWPKADMIIWCNYSFARVFWQLLRRTVTRCLTREELWNGNRERLYANFFTKQSIFVWMIKTWKHQSERYDLYFQTDGNVCPELRRLKTPRDAQKLLDSICN